MTPITPGKEIFDLKRVKTEPFDYSQSSQTSLEQSTLNSELVKDLSKSGLPSLEGATRSSDSSSMLESRVNPVKTEAMSLDMEDGGNSEEEDDRPIRTPSPGPTELCNVEHYRTKAAM